MNAAQREVLRKFSDVDCCKLDTFLAENVARRSRNPSTWISQLYQANKQVAENRAKFKAAFGVGGAETGVKHRLGAVLAHRVNNYSLRNGSKYVWKLDRSGLEQVSLAFPVAAANMMEASSTHPDGAPPQASSTGSVFVPSMETAASGSEGPPKRQRFQEAPVMATSSKAGTPTAPASWRAAPERGPSPPRVGATPKPMPKARPGHVNRMP
jgi:hypothetical protein